eukprot:NODE_4783_length_762_cov_23.440393_g4435_i0.p1 GENE.NODE_4783_length_762_cov_23.440393_g4435_i0~~NODE_4783_length_762_cov_23.440393_g4435_i0.p1  ORF type:complete len:134 (-),score=28.98 NODE_4783_length_762_cov_23.440393_g4435_i0:303-704(-)
MAATADLWSAVKDQRRALDGITSETFAALAQLDKSLQKVAEHSANVDGLIKSLTTAYHQALNQAVPQQPDDSATSQKATDCESDSQQIQQLLSAPPPKKSLRRPKAQSEAMNARADPFEEFGEFDSADEYECD